MGQATETETNSSHSTRKKRVLIALFVAVALSLVAYSLFDSLSQTDRDTPSDQRSEVALEDPGTPPPLPRLQLAPMPRRTLFHRRQPRLIHPPPRLFRPPRPRPLRLKSPPPKLQFPPLMERRPPTPARGIMRHKRRKGRAPTQVRMSKKVVLDTVWVMTSGITTLILPVGTSRWSWMGTAVTRRETGDRVVAKAAQVTKAGVAARVVEARMPKMKRVMVMGMTTSGATMCRWRIRVMMATTAEMMSRRTCR